LAAAFMSRSSSAIALARDAASLTSTSATRGGLNAPSWQPRLRSARKGLSLALDRATVGEGGGRAGRSPRGVPALAWLPRDHRLPVGVDDLHLAEVEGAHPLLDLGAVADHEVDHPVGPDKSPRRPIDLGEL